MSSSKRRLTRAFALPMRTLSGVEGSYGIPCAVRNFFALMGVSMLLKSCAARREVTITGRSKVEHVRQCSTFRELCSGTRAMESALLAANMAPLPSHGVFIAAIIRDLGCVWVCAVGCGSFRIRLMYRRVGCSRLSGCSGAPCFSVVSLCSDSVSSLCALLHLLISRF